MARAMPTYNFTCSSVAPGNRADGRLRRGHDVHGEEEDDGEDDDQGNDRLQLPAEVGVRAFADGVPDDLHLRGARVVAEHLPPQKEGIQQSQDGNPEDNPEGYGFEHRCVEKM